MSKAPPPVTPGRAFIPQRAVPDPYVDPPPKLFVDQPSDVTSTGDPPVRLHREWSRNRGRNRAMKRRGYLFTPPLEDFGPPQFILPGEEKTAPVPVFDLAVWRNAIVLVDKPKRWTSFDVCSKLRNALFRYPFKVGHTGTLDPLATGLLIVCLGNATQCVEKLTGLEKAYSGTLKLGEMTASYDSAEPISERHSWEHITDAQIEEAAQKLTGKIKQLPPMYSAVKQNGMRLYELARKGQTIKRKPRSATVTQFRVKRIKAGSQIVHYQIGCSSGTYVRSLVHDLGQSLGCGAYVRSLRRDAIGPYALEQAWELDALLSVIRASKIASR